MNPEKLRVLHIHSTDGGGGGGLVAYHLMEEYCKLGIDSELYVGNIKLSNDPRVKYLSRKVELINKVNNLLPFPRKVKAAFRIALYNLTSMKIIAYKLSGKEYRNIFGTEKNLKKLLELKPDIVHCHNLHSNYFDLSALISLSRSVTTVVTLHDAWMLTGHCAHYFDCMRWKEGCGNCLNLSVYPAVFKDATAYNWRKRKEIYKQCKLYVTAPSSWILNSAHESILEYGIITSAVIPNGIDLNIFHPGDSKISRSILSLPTDRHIIVFAASGLKKGNFKDYQTLHKSLEILGSSNTDVLCLALGDSGDTETIGTSVELRFIPFISDPNIVAEYYRAADVYVHPAKADTFPTSVIEAEACGLPVIASAVCGIPEQIEEGTTGYLVPVGDAEQMARRIIELKENSTLRERMGSNAAKLAKERYDQKIMVDKYLNFYKEIMK